LKCLSFLISTRGSKPDKLKALLSDIENQSYLNINVVVVLQPDNNTNTDNVLQIINGIAKPVNIVVSKTVGLSKSRNIAISAGTGDYMLLCDDDCRYPENAAAEIVEAMASRPDWDIITFQIADSDTDNLHKKYPSLAIRHTLRTIMRVSSVEIVLCKRIIDKTTLFDEQIGLGTPYVTGAENIMLVDAYKRKITAGFYPRTIVTHPIESSGRGSDFSATKLNQLVLSKAVMFRRMFGLWGILPALIFFVRRLFPGKALRFKPGQIRYLLRGLFIRLKF